jgi:tetratricopeptide (TPR) repeat protein
LNDNLDQVRALTDALAGEGNASSQVVAAAQALTPVARCADMAALRSNVPLPRDERTLHEVRRLRRELAAVRTMYDLGELSRVLERANALRPEVEATPYKPLLGEFMNLLGIAQSAIDADPSIAEETLRQAMIVAEAARDDITAANIAAMMIYVAGYRLGHPADAEFWADLAGAILDRTAGDQSLIRSWILVNRGAARCRVGDFAGARPLVEESVALKERSLGQEHPDLAESLSDLAYVLKELGHPVDALPVVTRAIGILLHHGDPDSYTLGYTYSNQGEVLNALGRFSNAEEAFEKAQRILRKNVGPTHPEVAFALHGLGVSKAAQGMPGAAIPLFEEALRIRHKPFSDPVLAADTQFALAQALWAAGPNRANAHALATSALKTYRSAHGRNTRAQAVESWLSNHRRPQ